VLVVEAGVGDAYSVVFEVGAGAETDPLSFGRAM
jgi:hypothetical protein